MHTAAHMQYGFKMDPMIVLRCLSFPCCGLLSSCPSACRCSHAGGRQILQACPCEACHNNALGALLLLLCTPQCCFLFGAGPPSSLGGSSARHLQVAVLSAQCPLQ